jgi:hypothetical protein
MAISQEGGGPRGVFACARVRVPPEYLTSRVGHGDSTGVASRGGVGGG